jgi:excisionase family DNA binding protein
MTRDRDVPLLTVAAAAKYAKVSERTVSTWVRAGHLEAIPHGRERLIPLDHLQQLMRDRFQNGGRIPTRRHAGA